MRKFDPEKLKKLGVFGPNVRRLENEGFLMHEGKKIHVDEVSWIRKGAAFVMISDTRWNKVACTLAKDATLLLCESTYLEEHRALAESHHHLTAKQAAQIAKEASAHKLILTHFSARYQDLNPFLEEARAVFPNTEVAEDLKYFDFPFRAH